MEPISLLFILWLYSENPWGNHQGHYSAGWVPIEVYDTEGECNKAAHDSVITKKYGADFAMQCLPENERPRGKVSVPLE